MKKQQEKYVCKAEYGTFYGILCVAIGLMSIAIVMLVVTVVENIVIALAASIICAIFSVALFIIAIAMFSGKFVISKDEVSIQKGKKVLSSKITDVKQIIVLKWVRDVRYIFFDCAEYPYVSANQIFSGECIVIKDTTRRLQTIKKLCPDCRIVYMERSI